MSHTFRTTLFTLFLCVLPGSGFAGALNINEADAPALAAGIDGVGPGRAAAIVRYREAHGRFTSVDQLSAIKGVGPRVLER
ncbi:MAG: ComEA family DNA-binding protein, partial [Gammaproteobacteria bacterium]